MKAIEEIKEVSFQNHLLVTVVLVGLLFAVSVVLFGVDSVMAGAHDTFHDFRHSIGMPCH